jgi:hypothetical protein
MGRPRSAKHGTRARYVGSGSIQGCRCLECKSANAAYIRDRKNAKLSGQSVADVVALRTKPPETNDSPAIGPVEQAVIDDFAELPAAQENSLLVANARSMARIMDNPHATGQYVQASKQLMTIIEKLTGAGGNKRKRKTGSRLATVSSLTKHRRAN